MRCSAPNGCSLRPASHCAAARRSAPDWSKGSLCADDNLRGNRSHRPALEAQPEERLCGPRPDVKPEPVRERGTPLSERQTKVVVVLSWGTHCPGPPSGESGNPIYLGCRSVRL